MANNHDPLEDLWKQVENLAYELKGTLADVNDMWAEISGMFGDVLYNKAIPPKLLAEYLVGSAQQLDFMQRATALLQVPAEINDRNRSKDWNRKVTDLTAAAAQMDKQFAEALFSETRGAIPKFLALKATIDEYPRKIKELQCSVLVAVYSPVYFIRDSFSGYLGRGRPSATMFNLLWDLAQEAGMHFLKDAAPLLGPIKAIAKAAHEHAEGRYESFKKGVEEQVQFQRLQDSVDEGIAGLETTERFVADWRVAEHKIDQDFDYAADRCTGALKIVSKDRADQKRVS